MQFFADIIKIVVSLVDTCYCCSCWILRSRAELSESGELHTINLHHENCDICILPGPCMIVEVKNEVGMIATNKL